MIVAALGVGVLLALTGSQHSAHGARSAAGAKRAAVTPKPARRDRQLGEASAKAQAAAVAHLASYGLPLYCGGRDKPMVALTFDDGPGPYTRLAVAKLHKHHVRASFFLVGKELHAYPGLAPTERTVGVVGDHTLTHPFLPSLTHDEMVQQIAGARSAIEAATAQRVVLFRPPYEGRTPDIDRTVKQLGMLEVLWTIDSGDSLGVNYAGIERNVVAGLHPGAIILMHENHGQTIRALLTIFAALQRKHLRAVTIPELVAEDPPSVQQLRAGGRGCGVTRRGGNGG